VSGQLQPPAALPPGKSPHTHWIGRWEGPRAGMEQILLLSGIEPLYRLNYSTPLRRKYFNFLIINIITFLGLLLLRIENFLEIEGVQSTTRVEIVILSFQLLCPAARPISYKCGLNVHILFILSRVGGVRVTKITGSRSDDWIYWHFIYNLS
jgi:hypothetical protein